MLELIRLYWQVAGEAPSVRLLARRLGLHVTTVEDHLHGLHAKGWLRTPSPGGWRA